MAGPGHCAMGLLVAATLGGALLGAPPPLPAQASAAGTKLQEVVITAGKEADAALTAGVLKMLQDDPYVFADQRCPGCGPDERLAAAAAAVCVIALTAIRRMICLQS